MDEEYIKALMKKYGTGHIDDNDWSDSPSKWDVADDYYRKIYSDYKDSWGPGWKDLEKDSTYTEAERKEIKRKWTGALVKFAGHISTYYKTKLSISTSTIPDTQMTGAVISLEPNYRDSWMAQILWSNGSLSGENIDDLVIIQAPPSK